MDLEEIKSAAVALAAQLLLTLPLASLKLPINKKQKKFC